MANETKVPTRKTQVAVVVGAFVSLIVAVLNHYVPFFESNPITGEVAALATTAFTSLAAYLTPPAADETVMTNAAGAVVTAKV